MIENAKEFFDVAEKRINASKIAGMNAIFQFVLKGDGGGEWHIAIKDGQARVLSGIAEKPDIEIAALATDVVDIINGKLSAQAAFLWGKLKIKGDIPLATKLGSIFGWSE
jgi:putative sterol carrier protein